MNKKENDRQQCIQRQVALCAPPACMRGRYAPLKKKKSPNQKREVISKKVLLGRYLFDFKKVDRFFFKEGFYFGKEILQTRNFYRNRIFKKKKIVFLNN